MKEVKPLAAAVSGLAVGVGIAVAGSAAALGLPKWLDKQPADATRAAATTPAQAAQPADGTAATEGATPARSVLPAPPSGAAPNFRAIVQTYGPAVVGVTVSGMHKAGANGSDDGDDDDAEPAQQAVPGVPFSPNDPFFRFFRGLPGFGQQIPRGDVPFRGQGSGFIVSTDGLILTNAHVVRDAKEVTVKLSDRREFRAKVLGADPDTDIAVLRIDAKGLPTVRVGDPKVLQVGDYVLAIGSPFGFEQSATQGIVSAKGRSLPGDSYVPFIQTDAAVNPGNSGGPLFDAGGSVVGINAQIYSQSGGYQGLAFAIPIDVALKVKDQIVATGRAQHARLGVQVQDLSQGLAESFGLPRPDGALIAGVAPGSAAAAAGLKSGDVVTAINGEPVVQASDLSTRIGMAAPGERVALKVWRDHGAKSIDVKLGNADDAKTRQARADDTGKGQLGLSVRPLSPQEQRAAQTDHGLLVQGVGGAAARAGLQPGDVVLAINGKPVNGIDEIRSVLDKKPKSVALLIQRSGEQIFVPVNLG